MKLLRAKHWWFIGMLSLVMAGCAGMLTQPERPEVSIVSINLVEPGLLEQRYRVQLRVLNPNGFDLPIDGIHIRVELNGHPFISGVSPAPVTVPRYSSALVEIDAVSTLAGLAHQLKGIASGQTEAVRYKLSGKVHLSQPMTELPFAQEGEISLSGLLGNTTH